jgi:iron complex outermembrane receptor protein
MDLGYRLNDHLKIFSSVNKTLRMPTFTDMFYTSPVQQGNSHLKPEEAVTFEAGFKYSSAVVKGEINAFHRRGYNLIDWVKDPTPDSLIWRTANHANISFAGVEASLSLTPSAQIPNGLFQSLRLSYSYLRADSAQDDMLSRYALDYLRQQVNLSVDLRIVSRLYNSTTVTWRDRNGAWPDSGGEVVSYDPFWLSDTRFSWKEQNFTVYIEASNVFNSRYFDFGGLIQPGIWIRGGMVMNLEYMKN